MTYLLSGRLIDSQSSYRWLIESSKKVNGRVSICSAFIRSSVLEKLEKLLPKKTPVRLLARWRLEDLLAGASDLRSYEISKNYGWEFYISINFHGKVFLLPPSGILVGSANATKSGLGLSDESNSEVCTIVVEDIYNNKFVDSIFNSGKKLDDQLFKQLKFYYESIDKQKISAEWPDLIRAQILNFSTAEIRLLLTECLCSDGKEILQDKKCNTFESLMDLSLLSLQDKKFDFDLVTKKFLQTKIYLFLKNYLEINHGEGYFGAITAAVHDALAEDPAPYRRDVKIVVKNLFSWVSYLNKNIGMVVDRPNHSERIRLL